MIDIVDVRRCVSKENDKIYILKFSDGKIIAVRHNENIDKIIEKEVNEFVVFEISGNLELFEEGEKSSLPKNISKDNIYSKDLDEKYLNSILDLENNEG